MTQENSQSPAPDRSFVQEALEQGNPTGWFNEVYVRAKGDEGAVPWAHLAPRPAFAEWLEETNAQGKQRKALVIACGLGDDAEALAARGFDVTAFDIAPTAIEWAKRRFPESSVNYMVADMFEPPIEWVQAFDLVLEVFTVQALPIDIRAKAVAGVSQFVASGGELLVITMGVAKAEGRTGPPWPLTKEELSFFQNEGLTELSFTELPTPPNRVSSRWRALYRRSA